MQAKEKLISSEILVHYDPTLPIKVAADASAYGVGAVLSHVIDGNERPIAFASRTLTSSEHNYAQVEKEGLALIFAVKKFHTYLYGREFTLVTGHKPLTTILGPKKGLLQLLDCNIGLFYCPHTSIRSNFVQRLPTEMPTVFHVCL